MSSAGPVVTDSPTTCRVFAAACRGPLNAILGPGKPGPGTDAFLVARKPARTATLAKQD